MSAYISLRGKYADFPDVLSFQHVKFYECGEERSKGDELKRLNDKLV
jgi:hypothetical protein